MSSSSPDLPLTSWDGARYQSRFDELAASGAEVHGEADFVMGFAPESALDAGCGTGRVAIELALRGVLVVGADKETSMLEVAQGRVEALAGAHPGLRVSFVQSDVVELDLGTTFDVVLMAGNVPLFTPPGTEAALVLGCARHVGPSGRLISGFGLGRSYAIEDYDRHCALGGLELEGRYATWSGEAWSQDSEYAVSVHRRG